MLGNRLSFRGLLDRMPIGKVHAARPSFACCSTTGPSQAAAALDRQEHNRIQADKFLGDRVQHFTQPLPDEIQQRLREIVGAVPDLGPSSRIIDVGSGTGCLVPHLQARGVRDLLAVDLSADMLRELSKQYRNPGPLGNDLGVRTWQGDVIDLPGYLGPADAFFFNAVFGNVYSPREALLRACLLLRPGGHIVISHPMGRAWHTELAASAPDMVPHQLPDRQGMEQLLEGLPLRLVGMRDEPEMYLALLQVPPRYVFPAAPVFMQGPVVTGFGRGSRQLGTPTANIDPVPLKDTLEKLPLGVYYGWAKLDAPAGWPAADSAVHKMVMNVGRRPTVNTGDEAMSVEVHIMHKFGSNNSSSGEADGSGGGFSEFYGASLRVVALGFLRPEIKFKGLPDLLARIKADVGSARVQLDHPEAEAMQRHPFFSG